MRLNRLRHRLISVIYYGPAISKRKRIILYTLAIFFVLSILFTIIATKIRPLILQIALGTTTDVVTLAVNDTITEMMSDGSMDYDELVNLVKDKDGNICALVTDMAKINSLQAEISSAIVKRLSSDETTVIKIPFGNIISGALFSGRGPQIPVKILSVSNVFTNFTNEFSSAGINQTRHQIMLNVEVTLVVFVPGYTTNDIVTTEMEVAETVIVGEVPNTYASIG